MSFDTLKAHESKDCNYLIFQKDFLSSPKKVVPLSDVTTRGYEERISFVKMPYPIILTASWSSESVSMKKDIGSHRSSLAMICTR